MVLNVGRVLLGCDMDGKVFIRRSQEFHSPRHMCCGDVTIKVI